MKTALITGASRGLGFAMGEALSKTHHIIAVARTIGGLEELDDAIQAQGGTATLAPLDLSDPSGTANLCAALFDEFGGVDLWVHTAVHAPPLAPVNHIDPKDFAKSIAMMATTTADLIYKIDPLLRPKNGTAAYMQDARLGEKFFGSYASAKQAEEALFQAWQAECEHIGPNIRALKPNPMATALRARFFPGEDRSTLATPQDETARLTAELLGG